MGFQEVVHQAFPMALGLGDGGFLGSDGVLLDLLGVDHSFLGIPQRVLQVAQGLGGPAQAVGQFAGPLEPRLAFVAVVGRVVPVTLGLLEVGGGLVPQQGGQLGFAFCMEVVAGERPGQGLGMILRPGQCLVQKFGHVLLGIRI